MRGLNFNFKNELRSINSIKKPEAAYPLALRIIEVITFFLSQVYIKTGT